VKNRIVFAIWCALASAQCLAGVTGQIQPPTLDVNDQPLSSGIAEYGLFLHHEPITDANLSDATSYVVLEDQFDVDYQPPAGAEGIYARVFATTTTGLTSALSEEVFRLFDYPPTAPTIQSIQFNFTIQLSNGETITVSGEQ